MKHFLTIFLLLVSVCVWGQTYMNNSASIRLHYRVLEEQSRAEILSNRVNVLGFVSPDYPKSKLLKKLLAGPEETVEQPVRRTVKKGTYAFEIMDNFVKQNPEINEFPYTKNAFEYNKKNIRVEFYRLVNDSYFLSLMEKKHAFFEYSKTNCDYDIWLLRNSKDACEKACKSLENALELVSLYCSDTGEPLNTEKLCDMLAYYNGQYELIEYLYNYYGEPNNRLKATGFFD